MSLKSYDELCKIVNDAIVNFETTVKKERPNAILWPETLKKMCKNSFEQSLNRYFNENAVTQIFTDEFHKLYVNSNVLAQFSIFNFKMKILPSYTISYSIISFTDFLKKLQWLGSFILLGKRNPDGWNLKYYERFFSLIDSRIEKLAADIEKKLFENVDEDNLSLPHSDEVWVFRNLSSLNCNTEAHEVKTVTLSVVLIDKPLRIDIPTFYCRGCDRYFVGEETLNIFRQEYGRMFIKTRPIIGEDVSQTRFKRFRTESELYSWGYNVIDGEMSAETRRKLLFMLFKERKMTKFEICRDIENAIRLFNGRKNYENALSRWREDLEYVNRLDMSAPQGIAVLREK